LRSLIRFKELESLETYAQDLDDFQLTGIVKVVRQYARLLPDVVFEIINVTKNSNDDQKVPAIILSTVHCAKGREYDRVYIDADIAASLSRPETLLDGYSGDEVNIAYVGFTRAIRELHLPPDFKTILTTQWQTSIGRYVPAHLSRRTTLSLKPRKRAPDFSTTGIGSSKSRPKKSFKCG